jgi:hypothetical protein
MADIDKMTPHTCRFIGEDGQTHNIVDLLNGINQRFNDYATKQYVDDAIASIVDGNSIEY